MTKTQKVNGSTTMMDKKFHGQTGDQANQVVEVPRAVHSHLDPLAPVNMVNGRIGLVPGITFSFVNSR